MDSTDGAAYGRKTLKKMTQSIHFFRFKTQIRCNIRCAFNEFNGAFRHGSGEDCIASALCLQTAKRTISEFNFNSPALNKFQIKNLKLFPLHDPPWPIRK